LSWFIGKEQRQWMIFHVWQQCFDTVCYVTERGHLASKNINQFTADILPLPGVAIEKASGDPCVVSS